VFLLPDIDPGHPTHVILGHFLHHHSPWPSHQQNTAVFIPSGLSLPFPCLPAVSPCPLVAPRPRRHPRQRLQTQDRGYTSWDFAAWKNVLTGKDWDQSFRFWVRLGQRILVASLLGCGSLRLEIRGWTFGSLIGTTNDRGHHSMDR